MKQVLGVSILFSFFILSLNMSMTTKVWAEVFREPRLSGGVWYFLRTPPSPPPAKIATKEEADQYFAPLLTELRKRNPAVDARAAYTKGQRFLLGMPMPIQRGVVTSPLHPEMMAQIMRGLGVFMESSLWKQAIKNCPLVYIEGYIDDRTYNQETYCHYSAACMGYPTFASDYLHRFSKIMVKLCLKK